VVAAAFFVVMAVAMMLFGLGGRRGSRRCAAGTLRVASPGRRPNRGDRRHEGGAKRMYGFIFHLNLLSCPFLLDVFGQDYVPLTCSADAHSHQRAGMRCRKLQRLNKL